MTRFTPPDEFEGFIASLPPRTVIHVAFEDKGYEVDYFSPAVAQADLPGASVEIVPEPKSPPQFTYDTDPPGCERMANARGKRF